MSSHPHGSFLAVLDAEDFARIEGVLTRVFVAGGATLWSQDEPADALCIVDHGRLRAVAEGPNGRRVLGEVGQGDTVGELALLTGAPRSATVEAVRDTWLWRLAQSDFEALLTQSPKAALALARLVARRTRGLAGDRRVTPPATIAVMPCGRAPVDMRAFVAALMVALAPHRPLLIDRGYVEEALGAHEAGATVRVDFGEPAARLLHDLEKRHPLLVYLADPANNAWTRRSLRQADRILFVVGDDPALSEHERELSARGWINPAARAELVRVLPDDTRAPSGTLAWLTPRPVAAHHHVRLGVPADFARLGRCVTGRPLGLALSGGSARGMAHLGLLRALREADIPVDVVVGTSAGAILGALYARGDEPEAIGERVIAAVRTGIVDPTLPLVSLMVGRRYARSLQRLFGDGLVEDTWLPCCMVSADLVTAEVVVHDRGPLWFAARATSSLPGVMPPVRMGDRLLVDGATMNNLPVDVLRDRWADPLVIAHDVAPPGTAGWAAQSMEHPSGWRVLWNWLRGRPTPPMFADLFPRAAMLAATRHQRAIAGTQGELYLCPPLERFGSFDRKSFAEIVRVGYDTAREALDRWQAAGLLPLGGAAMAAGATEAARPSLRGPRDERARAD